MNSSHESLPNGDKPFLVVLGIAQDGGYPQAGCYKDCCTRAWEETSLRRYASCLAIIDPKSNDRWFIDCTPNYPDQLYILDRISPPRVSPGISGFLLTHAHVGHYTGLVHLGREVINGASIPVYAMPRMTQFLMRNEPWNQLVQSRNIELCELVADETVRLNDRVAVTPFLVPHRDEFSETVGYRIDGPSRSAIYLPDIDKWQHWTTDIESVLAAVDVAYLDGTFYDDEEISGRDMSEIPHPFIKESIERFSTLPKHERQKVRFLHLNHTNPALNPTSKATRTIHAAGHRVCEQGEQFVI